jgi:ribonuclease HI
MRQKNVWIEFLHKRHINLLEMRAVLLALSHFKLFLESLSIVLATDNTTVVQMSRENFQDRNRGFPILRRRGPMLEKIKL